MGEKAETFVQFWRHYLRDHARAGTKVLHFVGTGLGVAALISRHRHTQSHDRDTWFVDGLCICLERTFLD